MDNFLEQSVNFCVSVEEMKRIGGKFNEENSMHLEFPWTSIPLPSIPYFFSGSSPGKFEGSIVPCREGRSFRWPGKNYPLFVPMARRIGKKRVVCL